MREASRSLITVRSVACVVLLAAPLLIWQTGSADLDVYRHGAEALLHGRSLYASSFAARSSTHLPFTYPPFAALAAVPVELLPRTLATWAWALATVAALGFCVRVGFRERLQDRNADLEFAVILAVALYTRPVFDHLGDGQVDIFLMAMCVADTVTESPKWPRGLLVGAATAVKLVPGIFIVHLWTTGRRRAAGVAAGVFVGCELLAAVATLGESHRYWTHLVFNTERPGYTAGYKNQSLRGIALRLLASPGRSEIIAAVVVMIALIGLARARRAHANGDPTTGATLTGLAGVTTSPVSWIHAAVWLIPAIGRTVAGRVGRARWAAATAAAVILLIGVPYVPNVVPGLPSWMRGLLWDSYGLMCLGFLLALPAVRPEDRQTMGR